MLLWWTNFVRASTRIRFAGGLCQWYWKRVKVRQCSCGTARLVSFPDPFPIFFIRMRNKVGGKKGKAGDTGDGAGSHGIPFRGSWKECGGRCEICNK